MKKLKVKNLASSIEQPFKASEVFVQLRDDIMNDRLDGEKVYVFFHQMSELFEMIKKDHALKPALENRFHGWGDSPKYGFKAKCIEKKLYDFKGCNDPIFDTIGEEIKALTEAKKERESYLKVYQGDEFQKPTISFSSYIELRKAS
jgi:hypothetical protein